MMSSLGFFFGLLLRFVRWFTRRAGTSISSLISSYWCVASVYCIGSPDERVRLFLLWFSFWFVDLLYCFGSPDERVRSFNLLLSSFCCCLFSLDHPTSGYDHLILYLLPLVYGFSFLFVLPSSGDYRSPFVVGLLLLLPPTEVGRRSFVFCCLSLFLEVAPNGSWQAKISSFVVVSSRFTTSGYKRLVFCCLYLFLVVAPNVSWQAMVSSFVFYTNSICTNLLTCQSEASLIQSLFS